MAAENGSATRLTSITTKYEKPHAKSAPLCAMVAGKQLVQSSKPTPGLHERSQPPSPPAERGLGNFSCESRDRSVSNLMQTCTVRTSMWTNAQISRVRNKKGSTRDYINTIASVPTSTHPNVALQADSCSCCMKGSLSLSTIKLR